MNELIAVATITVLAVISPGPDFAMVTRNSYAFGSRIGLFSALGITYRRVSHAFYGYENHWSVISYFLGI